ncbi:outer membrane protein [Coralliovum pocilloporae]|uniref:outer membrane protein n=1 Tax=Coralliovum pocilloporae TaxID=3066369 RepID=UPI003306D243
MNNFLLLAAFFGTFLISNLTINANAEEPYDWSGSYFGIKGGAIFSDANITNSVISSGTLHNAADGVTIGVMSGYNWQHGHWVVGIDTDFSYSSLEDEFAGSLSLDTNYIGTIRARVGYTYDRFLPYVTAGLATSYVDATSVLAATNSSLFLGSKGDFLYGFTVGGGVEWAIDDTWRVRAEYLYVNYEEDSVDFPVLPLRATFDELHLVRVGISMDTDQVLDGLFGG